MLASGNNANDLAQAIERKMFDSGKTVVYLNADNLGEDALNESAAMLKSAGLVVVVAAASLKDFDEEVSADSEADIIAALKKL